MSFLFPKQSKYKNRKTSDGDRSYMSQGERDCAHYLRLREKVGEIRDLQFQVSVRLGPNSRRWVLDFKYFDTLRGCDIYADFKGFETDRWKHLLDLWALEGPGPLLVYKGRGLRMEIAQEVLRKERT